MGLNKKSNEKYFEKDPFLVPISNNNTAYVLCCEEKPRLSCPGMMVSTVSSLHSLSLMSRISLILLGLVCFIVSPQLEAALVSLVQSWTALVSGPMLSAWLTPPVLPLLKIYVFNITNPHQVLSGLDPVTEELGPYVYSATHLRRLVSSLEETSGESIQFRSRTVYKFVPELSSGSESDPLTVLNMVMLTAFNKARSSPHFVKTNVLLPLVSSLGRPEPLLTVTVGGFLFGYPDNLACLASQGANNDEATEETDDEWDNWDDDEDDEFLSRRRRDSGDCLWGVLKDLNNTEHETVRIKTGKTDFRSKGEILDIDGKTSFGAWQKDSGCDQISGSTEPSSLPAGLKERFSMMLPVMCRTVEMVEVEKFTIQDIPVTRYEAEHDTLEQEACYCPDPGSGECLPSGYLSLESCYPDITPPLAVSFPHGLHSPPNSLLTHRPRPDYHKHNIHIDLNTQLGVPLAVQVNFQLSAILRPDPAFPVLNKINQTRLVPLFWASEGFDSPTDWIVSQTKLALRLPSALSLGGAGAILGLGLLLVVLWLWRR